MRFLSLSMPITFTCTCWWMLTTVVGSLTNWRQSCETCTKPFSLIPTSTKQPKLVMLVTMPGRVMPSFKSSMVFTFLSNSNTWMAWRGSRPGFSSSAMMSVRVGRPTLSLTYFLISILLRISLFLMRSSTEHFKSLAMSSTTA